MQPLNQAVINQLAAYMQHAQATGQLVQILGPDMLAALNPPDTEQRLIAGIPFEEVPVKDPMPWLPVSRDIAWGLNDRVITFTNETVNVEAIQNLGFDLPSVVYALTAAVRDTSGNALGGQFGSVLDTFRLQFEWNQGRKWQTSNAMGSTIVGTAQRPRFLGRPGWRFNKGSTLLVKTTPLVPNLQIDIVVWAIETSGPGNLSPMIL